MLVKAEADSAPQKEAAIRAAICCCTLCKAGLWRLAAREARGAATPNADEKDEPGRSNPACNKPWKGFFVTRTGSMRPSASSSASLMGSYAACSFALSELTGVCARGVWRSRCCSASSSPAHAQQGKGRLRRKKKWWGGCFSKLINR